MRFFGQVTALKGIGEKKAGLLKKLKIEKIEDFFYFYPVDYQDRRSAVRIADLIPGSAFLIKAEVLLIKTGFSRHRKSRLMRLLVSDGSAALEIVFFNAKYLTNSFKQGAEYYFYGKITADNEKQQMIHPEFLSPGERNEKGIFPVYPLTAGISQLEMRKWQQAANAYIEEVEEHLPDDIIERNKLCGIKYALKNIHFPGDRQKLKEARFRLVFDELFFLQTGLLALRGAREPKTGGIRFSKAADIAGYVSKLPYDLTNAQQKAVREIIGDMESSRVMNRLLQGDVGCGKTAVAEIALFKACVSGYQGVLMAPTELLARQHYDNLKKSFAPSGLRTWFLSSSLSSKEKKETLSALKEGEVDILIGTNAVIQEGVEFKNLGLVITDEQHRFGVSQRLSLARKGNNPDVLVMSATPIPRTLAMILYGDLDISIIDELPPGRQKIVTRVVSEDKRDASYEFIRSEVRAGKQAYVVAPLIDDSDVIDARSAESIYEELISRFPEYNAALLHGEMKPGEKDEIMEKFYDGRISVLVSTVVIEVGINVPNATVMLIESAERFGLAQLHQLRGRVGRGEAGSYCILINGSDSKLAAERAEAMLKSTDGFEIAEMDLKLRGPGDFFGTRQHGIPDLRIADLLKHMSILETVRGEAAALLEKDPDLSLPAHGLIKEKIRRQLCVL